MGCTSLCKPMCTVFVYFERVNGTTEEANQLNLQSYAVFFFFSINSKHEIGVAMATQFNWHFHFPSVCSGQVGQTRVLSDMWGWGCFLLPVLITWGMVGLRCLTGSAQNIPSQKSQRHHVKTAWMGCWGSGWPCRVASAESQFSDRWGLLQTALLIKF